jgi:hypothetical protein
MSQRIKIGSMWTFKHAVPKVIVKVYEINIIRNKKNIYTVISYGLRSSPSGHINCVLEGFLENYTLDKNG